MRSVARLRGGLAILLIAACAQAANTGNHARPLTFPHAFATRGCTQEDAPALEIYLTQVPFGGEGDPAPPYIRIEISSSPAEIIPPATLRLSPLRRDLTKRGRVVRAELFERGHDPVPLSGTIVLEAAAPGGSVSGRFDVTTPERRHLTGRFHTPYSTRPAVCG